MLESRDKGLFKRIDLQNNTNERSENEKFQTCYTKCKKSEKFLETIPSSLHIYETVDEEEKNRKKCR